MKRSAFARAAAGAVFVAACGHSPAPVKPAGTPAVPTASGVTSIAAAGSSACAATRGAVYCWGANLGGQLGDGTTARRATAARVAGVDGATTVTVGGGHACALVAGGEVRCWGDDSAGQLGDGRDGTTGTAPVTVKGLAPAKAVVAGFAHTCAITLAGAVFCWGKNHRGQLGDGTFADQLAPVHVTAPVAVDDAVQIAAVDERTCALRATGKIVCWGGHLPDGKTYDEFAPSSFDDVASFSLFNAATTQLCVVRRGGTVLCGDRPVLWHDATSIAGGSAITCALRGSAPTCWSSGNFMNEAFTMPSDATALAVGGDFACVARAGGGIACWGGNDEGQLGDGRFGRAVTPVAVVGVADAVDLAAGDARTCVATRSGGVACWGGGEGESGGEGANGNDAMAHVHDAVRVAAGVSFTCALHAGGALSCFGKAPLTTLAGVAAVSARGSTVCAALASGAVTCASLDAPAPWTVVGIDDATAVVVGEDQACALRRTGKLACFGLPRSSFAVDDAPAIRVRKDLVEVPGLPDVADFGVADSLFVVTHAGQLFVWRGALEGAPAVDAPVAIAGVDDALAASPPCALRRGGHVACVNKYDVPKVAKPVAIEGAAQVSAGPYHACARRTDGGVVCWGDDARGRLGDGHTSYERAAAPVIGLP